MPALKRVRIFVASPGDVQSEREQLKKVIEELNLTITALAPEKGLVLELLRWETHVPPGAAEDAQQQVNAYISDEYEIFVGIMWKRMGTATSRAASGTEEEFRRAKAKWDEDRSAPIMFYFCQEPFPPPRTIEDVEQLHKVIKFRESISTTGLVADFAGHASFADVVRPHLLLTLGKMYRNDGVSVAQASLTQKVAQVDAAGTLASVERLAREYETIRRTTEPGDARTRKMEIVASKMRSLALAGMPLIKRLMVSESPGFRLAAISFLESLPEPAHLRWLAQRVAVEKPFAGYHAALALLNAARTLSVSHRKALLAAIGEAKQALTERANVGSDRWSLLVEAEKEAEAVTRRRVRPAARKTRRSR